MGILKKILRLLPNRRCKHVWHLKIHSPGCYDQEAWLQCNNCKKEIELNEDQLPFWCKPRRTRETSK